MGSKKGVASSNRRKPVLNANTSTLSSSSSSSIKHRYHEFVFSSLFPQEFNRLVLSLSDAWRISRVNHNLDICPTYPRLVLVPKPVDDDSILKIAKFRQRARFPVLAYFHKPTQMVLLRSSQVDFMQISL